MPPKRKAAAAAEVSRKRSRNESDTAEQHSTASGASSRRRLRSPDDKQAGSQRTRSKRTQIPTKSSIDAEQDSEGKSDKVQPAKKTSSKKGRTKDAASTHLPEGTIHTEATGSKKAAGSSTDKNYWLMKAEPEDRFENGYNVKFSIDDLEAATKPEPWDGVRNYVARNNMIAMQQGDLAFFYHSNCTVPGIVGIMKILQEHSIDESAFDSKHPYYDPKSQREKPRWELVHVGFVKKFAEKISLKQIQQRATEAKELEDMDLLKYKRLSVTRVKPNEWEYIMKWASES